MGNVQVQIVKHSNTCNDSKPARRLRENNLHPFNWCIFCGAQSFGKRKIVEGQMLQQWQPSLNKQIEYYMAKLFPSGIN